MTDPERTIAAQATAAGQGAIAVIRMERVPAAWTS